MSESDADAVKQRVHAKVSASAPTLTCAEIVLVQGCCTSHPPAIALSAQLQRLLAMTAHSRDTQSPTAPRPGPRPSTHPGQSQPPTQQQRQWVPGSRALPVRKRQDGSSTGDAVGRASGLPFGRATSPSVSSPAAPPQEPHRGHPPKLKAFQHPQPSCPGKPDQLGPILGKPSRGTPSATPCKQRKPSAPQPPSVRQGDGGVSLGSTSSSWGGPDTEHGHPVAAVPLLSGTQRERALLTSHRFYKDAAEWPLVRSPNIVTERHGEARRYGSSRHSAAREELPSPADSDADELDASATFRSEAGVDGEDEGGWHRDRRSPTPPRPGTGPTSAGPPSVWPASSPHSMSVGHLVAQGSTPLAHHVSELSPQHADMHRQVRSAMAVVTGDRAQQQARPHRQQHGFNHPTSSAGHTSPSTSTPRSGATAPAAQTRSVHASLLAMRTADAMWRQQAVASGRLPAASEEDAYFATRGEVQAQGAHHSGADLFEGFDRRVPPSLQYAATAAAAAAHVLQRPDKAPPVPTASSRGPPGALASPDGFPSHPSQWHPPTPLEPQDEVFHRPLPPAQRGVQATVGMTVLTGSSWTLPSTTTTAPVIAASPAIDVPTSATPSSTWATQTAIASSSTPSLVPPLQATTPHAAGFPGKGTRVIVLPPASSSKAQPWTAASQPTAHPGEQVPLSVQHRPQQPSSMTAEDISAMLDAASSRLLSLQATLPSSAKLDGPRGSSSPQPTAAADRLARSPSAAVRAAQQSGHTAPLALLPAPASRARHGAHLASGKSSADAVASSQALQDMTTATRAVLQAAQASNAASRATQDAVQAALVSKEQGSRAVDLKAHIAALRAQLGD